MTLWIVCLRSLVIFVSSIWTCTHALGSIGTFWLKKTDFKPSVANASASIFSSASNSSSFPVNCCHFIIVFHILLVLINYLYLKLNNGTAIVNFGAKNPTLPSQHFSWTALFWRWIFIVYNFKAIFTVIIQFTVCWIIVSTKIILCYFANITLLPFVPLPSIFSMVYHFPWYNPHNFCLTPADCNVHLKKSSIGNFLLCGCVVTK